MSRSNLLYDSLVNITAGIETAIAMQKISWKKLNLNPTYQLLQ